MLDKKFIRENPDLVRETLQKRGLVPDLEDFLGLEARRLVLMQEVESLRARQNQASEEIGRGKREGRKPDPELTAGLRAASEQIKSHQNTLAELEKESDRLILTFPNLPHASTPPGRDARDNPEVRKVGEPRKFPFAPRPHWEVAEKLGLIDLERAARMSGSSFPLFTGLGARLERALIQFMLDLHTGEHGYLEIAPPLLVSAEAMTGTGQLPKFAAELYRVEDPELYLIPTAEVPLVNLHRDEILKGGDLPLSLTAYTPCFRREAGAHGRDTRGLIRQHQFDKVELVKFTTPESSSAELEKLVGHAEEVLKRLALPYRVISLCTGDLGFASAKTYDLEVWLPGEGEYREISSCSNCETFQARRANIRFRPAEQAKPAFVHTLNGSGLAVGRTLVAVLENFQEEDGSVTIPEALRRYMGGIKQISP